MEKVIDSSKKTFKDSLKKSFKWTLWNIGFGLLPAWVALFLSLIDPKLGVFSTAEKILFRDNALMFFSVAVITAITIDFKMAIEFNCAEKEYSWITTWNNLASSIVVLISTAVYARYYGSEITDNEVLINIIGVSVGVFLFTMFHVLILKFYQIYYRPF